MKSQVIDLPCIAPVFVLVELCEEGQEIISRLVQHSRTHIKLPEEPVNFSSTLDPANLNLKLGDLPVYPTQMEGRKNSIKVNPFQIPSSDRFLPSLDMEESPNETNV